MKNFTALIYIFRYHIGATAVALALYFMYLVVTAWMGKPNSVWLICDLLGLNVCN